MMGMYEGHPCAQFLQSWRQALTGGMIPGPMTGTSEREPETATTPARQHVPRGGRSAGEQSRGALSHLVEPRAPRSRAHPGRSVSRRRGKDARSRPREPASTRERPRVLPARMRAAAGGMPGPPARMRGRAGGMPGPSCENARSRGRDAGSFLRECEVAREGCRVLPARMRAGAGGMLGPSCVNTRSRGRMLGPSCENARSRGRDAGSYLRECERARGDAGSAWRESERAREGCWVCLARIREGAGGMLGLPGANSRSREGDVRSSRPDLGVCHG
jgi:hypothetical protein